MLFNSLPFAVFLPIVLLLYWKVRHEWRAPLLVVASYVFYAWWDVRFLGLIILSTLIDYTIGRRLGATTDERKRGRLLLASLCVNLGILGIFKYLGFFVESANALLGGVGLDTSSPLLSIALPVGISFYTFQTISYTFDVHRKRIEPESSLVVFAAYVAYFPQLVAGPIERARALLPQLREPRTPPDFGQVRSGVTLIAVGLLKKVVIADGLASIVNDRYADPESFSAASLLIAVYAFSLQIYGDFSGYSSIARGVSRLFGIELMRNFEQPYLSASITQFWRTWHISLSGWLHDYLYVPLGGNRGGRFATYRNLMLTMVLGGLWHGAAWAFVVWGALHGLLLAGHRIIGAYEPRGKPPLPKAKDIWRILITFHVVTVVWVFFRADTLSGAMDVLRRIASGAPGELEPYVLWRLVLSGAIVLALDLVDRSRDTTKPLERIHPALLGVCFGVVILGLLVFGGGAPVPFIYFQF